MDKIVSLCKRRGFIFPGSELYGGLSGTWDYGPLGVLLKNNIKREWWHSMVELRDDVVGIDAAILMNPKVWEASGHVEAFTDPLVECEQCHKRFRVDQLMPDPSDLSPVRKEVDLLFKRILDHAERKLKDVSPLLYSYDKILQKKNVPKLSNEEANKLLVALQEIRKTAEDEVRIAKRGIDFAKFLRSHLEQADKLTGVVTQIHLNRLVPCPECQSLQWTRPRQFNLLMKTFVGPVEDEGRPVYLRGEITQGVHVNFKNILDSTRLRLPFGVVQVGKAFRNEITPSNFTFRSREFEQMELQYFVRPEEKEGKKWFDYWKRERMQWYVGLGMNKEKLRLRDHEPHERAHYARLATDIEYAAPFGWKEFEGIHHRGDWDLSRHAQASGKDLMYYDEKTKERFIPWVIETSGGVDRAALFFLLDAYCEELINDELRVVLKLHPKLAPFKVGVFPLLANRPALLEKAKGIYAELKPRLAAAWDDRGNIGKRYYAQDEIGTPWCVTVDFQTLEDNTVTVRERDTMKQERIAAGELPSYFQEKLQD